MARQILILFFIIMLTIRLQRIGKKKCPVYRVVISEKSRDTQAKNLEILGSYNPHDKEKGLILKEDRIKYWIGNGAQSSNTVHNLFVKAGILSEGKKKSVVITKKRIKKIEEKKVASEAAKAKAKEAEQAKKEAVVEEIKPEPVSEEAVVEEKKEEVVLEDKAEGKE
ncbi:MAG: 30S ribosomal protein S16 [bacterium]